MEEKLRQRSLEHKKYEDYTFKSWMKEYVERKNDISSSIQQKRMAESKSRLLNNSMKSFFHGHFHELVEKEKEQSLERQIDKMRRIKELNDKKTRYLDDCKQKIKIKTKHWEPLANTKPPGKVDLKLRKAAERHV
mmetsp:Transcript_25354/g.22395  ORF Transcript_25354/g.22395 Transcript_25354/m.22395 type:complete len:135 (+) Transcript_25354:900-1304(+)